MTPGIRHRHRMAAPALAAAAAIGVSACGGSAGATAHASNAAASVAHSRPTRIYKVALSSALEKSGAPQGHGFAIIAFHGASVVCWRFAHLHGFTNATFANVYTGSGRRPGPVAIPLMRGPRLHHEGCARTSPLVSRRIWSDPRGYYVNVFSTRYPHGAVRAQL